MWIKIKAVDYDRLRDLEKVSENLNREIDDLYKTLGDVREKHQAECDTLQKEIDHQHDIRSGDRAELHRTHLEVTKWKGEAENLRNQLCMIKLGTTDVVAIAKKVISTDPATSSTDYKKVEHIKALRSTLGAVMPEYYGLKACKDLIESVYVELGLDSSGYPLSSSQKPRFDTGYQS